MKKSTISLFMVLALFLQMSFTSCEKESSNNGSSSSSSSSSSSTSSSKTQCGSCYGKGLCRYCKGTGINVTTKNGKCGVCKGKGACYGCSGKGYY